MHRWYAAGHVLTAPRPSPADRLWPLLFLGLSLGLAHHLLLFSGLRVVHGDEGDARFVHYVLEHGWRWLSGDALHRSFWDPPFFHPTRNAAAYSEVLLGVAPPYWLWRALGLDPSTAYPLWLCSVTALNFGAMYLLLRTAFGATPLAASAGAMLFAAGASRINQLNHPQLTAHFWSIAAIGALVAAFRSRGTNRAALWIGVAACSCVAQLYGGFYWGWFLGFFLLVAVAVAVVTPSLRRELKALVFAHPAALGISATVAAACLFPLASHYLAAARETGFRSYEDSLGMIPQLQSWFHMGDASWLYGWTARWSVFQKLPVEGEQRVGLGLLTTTVMVTACWQHRRLTPARVVSVVGVVVVLLATLYRFKISPWELVFHTVPGANAIRAVSRVGIWLLLPAAIGLALALDRLRLRGRNWAAVALGALCLLEQGLRQGGFDAQAAAADVARIAGEVRGCKSFFYSPEHPSTPEWKYQLDAMWASLQAGVPTVNGYSGKVPPGWELEDPVVRDDASARRISAALERWMRARGLAPAEVCRVRYQAPR